MSKTHIIGGLKVKICHTFVEAQADWSALEINCDGSIYQTFIWCETWFACAGLQSDIQPLIIVLLNNDDVPLLILPLQIRNKFGQKLLEWLAQSENNYGFGLFGSPTDGLQYDIWFENNFALLNEALPKYDVVNLQNMPTRLFDRLHPLLFLSENAAANSSYIFALNRSFDELIRSKRTVQSISKINRRDQRLSEIGELKFEVFENGDQGAKILEECIEHKRQQLAMRGIQHALSPLQLEFFVALLENNAKSAVKLVVFQLSINGRTISSAIGGVYNSSFSLMILSMAPDAPLALSPGDMTLRNTISWACEQNLTLYDLSNGEADYKLVWADEQISLFNCFKARSLKGLPLAAALMALHFVKRILKRNHLFYGAFDGMRRRLFGRAHQS